jgi:hypothetical protein
MRWAFRSTKLMQANASARPSSSARLQRMNSIRPRGTRSTADVSHSSTRVLTMTPVPQTWKAASTASVLMCGCRHLSRERQVGFDTPA